MVKANIPTGPRTDLCGPEVCVPPPPCPTGCSGGAKRWGWALALPVWEFPLALFPAAPVPSPAYVLFLFFPRLQIVALLSRPASAVCQLAPRLPGPFPLLFL